jgi:hypothetical protein
MKSILPPGLGCMAHVGWVVGGLASAFSRDAASLTGMAGAGVAVTVPGVVGVEQAGRLKAVQHDGLLLFYATLRTNKYLPVLSTALELCHT